MELTSTETSTAFGQVSRTAMALRLMYSTFHLLSSAYLPVLAQCIAFNDNFHFKVWCCINLFVHAGSGSSSNPCTFDYHGESPADNPETAVSTQCRCKTKCTRYVWDKTRTINVHFPQLWWQSILCKATTYWTREESGRLKEFFRLYSISCRINFQLHSFSLMFVQSVQQTGDAYSPRVVLSFHTYGYYWLEPYATGDVPSNVKFW